MSALDESRRLKIEDNADMTVRFRPDIGHSCSSIRRHKTVQLLEEALNHDDAKVFAILHHQKAAI